MRKHNLKKCLGAMLLGMLFFSSIVPAAVDRLSISQIVQDGNDVYLYVSMLDNSGRPSSEAGSTEQFSVNIDKKKKITVKDATVFSSSDQGVSYIFCIDISKSVTEEEMQEIRRSLTSFVAEMSENDYARMITIGADVQSICDSTNDRDMLNMSIQNIARTADFTYLYKGISFALNGQRKNIDSMPERAAVVLFTDGMDDSDGASGEEQVLMDVAETRIPIYVVGLKGNDPNANLNSVGQIARQSGGSVFSYSDMSIADAVQNVEAIMQNTYRLHVKPEEENFGIQNLAWTVTYSSQDYSVSSSNYVYSLGMDNVVFDETSGLMPGSDFAETPSPAPSVEPIQESSPTPSPESAETPSPIPSPESAETPSPAPSVEPIQESSPTPSPESAEAPSPAPSVEPIQESSPAPSLDPAEESVITKSSETVKNSTDTSTSGSAKESSSVPDKEPTTTRSSELVKDSMAASTSGPMKEPTPTLSQKEDGEETSAELHSVNTKDSSLDSTLKPTKEPLPTLHSEPVKDTVSTLEKESMEEKGDSSDNISVWLADKRLPYAIASAVGILIFVVIILRWKKKKEKNNLKKDRFKVPGPKSLGNQEEIKEVETLPISYNDEEETVGIFYDREDTIDAMNEDGIMLEFEITFDGRTETSELLLREELILGRGDECDVDVVFRSYQKESKLVSRRHAYILNRPDGLYVKDNSRNGTYLNGMEVRGEVALRNEDVIQLGKSIVKVRILNSGR